MKIKLIFLLLFILTLIGLVNYNYVVKSSYIFNSYTNYSLLTYSNFKSPSNLQVLKRQYWKRIYFEFKNDQSNNIISLFEPISLCEVRGFPLITPLFKEKIKVNNFKNFNYYWRFIPNKSSNNGRHILIALHKTNEYGWFLKSGIIYHDRKPTKEYLLKWQSDPFWKKQGCNFKFLVKE